jgi:transposase
LARRHGYPSYRGWRSSLKRLRAFVGIEALRPFWALLGRRARNIERVVIDMSPAYIKAVSENLPHAFIVFDHFHVHRMANSMVDDLRRYLFNLFPRADKNILRGSRFLLLKNEENLNEERHER